MTIKSLISPIALATALAFSGAAYAQTMVGTQDITDEDLPQVQAQCETLLAEEMSPDAGEEEATETDPVEDADDADASGMDAAAPMVDLTTITLEDCREAGLVD